MTEDRAIEKAMLDCERRNTAQASMDDQRRADDIRHRAIVLAVGCRTMTADGQYEPTTQTVERAAAFEQFLKGEVTATASFAGTDLE